MKKYYLGLLMGLFAIFSFVQAADFPQEMQQAHKYAYANGITTIQSIENAMMYSDLNRIAMAKMISNYAINILGLQPDESIACSFEDVSSSLDAQYDNGVTKACQLGLMGLGDDGKVVDKFYPHDIVTRAQFATAFSRALNKAEGTSILNGNPYYAPHITYLHSKGVINSVDTPANNLEKRGYVMLMIRRASMMRRASSIKSDGIKNKNDEIAYENKEESMTTSEVKEESNSNNNQTSLSGDSNDTSIQTTSNTLEAASNSTSTNIPEDTTCDSEESCLEYLNKLYKEKNELTCIYDDGQEDYIMEGYVTTKSNMLNMLATNSITYLWGGGYGENQGIQIETGGDVTSQRLSSLSNLLKLGIKITCTPGVTDKSVFQLPKDITIMSIDDLMDKDLKNEIGDGEGYKIFSINGYGGDDSNPITHYQILNIDKPDSMNFIYLNAKYVNGVNFNLSDYYKYIYLKLTYSNGKILDWSLVDKASLTDIGKLSEQEIKNKYSL